MHAARVVAAGVVAAAFAGAAVTVSKPMAAIAPAAMPFLIISLHLSVMAGSPTSGFSTMYWLRRFDCLLGVTRRSLALSARIIDVEGNGNGR
ncbi:hypothetical protein Airi01_059470 [Actinoallomurus iriomotensis]|uniref:Uncharacterized protein n=1 Tax=Actinoallomurus iriomotensis TaxID=478107 RepID=A0A9W6RPP6_9ACTN|nr:hypothetical protein Airi01_059470 [Actinoallomurus iriomotensis]